MSSIDELCGYIKMLEGNMEKREAHVKQGGFVCDGTCDKKFTEEDIKFLQASIDSFKEKINKLASVMNELFDTKFEPYPKDVKEEQEV